MIHVVIVAAGSGTRFGGDVPKQFQNLNGRPVVMLTIEAFRRAVPDADIKLVLSESMAGYWAEMTEQYDFASPEVVYGGATRFDSVKNAITEIERAGIAEGDLILIHDGARPLVSNRVIANVIDGATSCGAAVPV
ncbi:MAG: 2-C-methyl-D-erythritol 4-phosphate cytidylyltransferase, partial [Muribaculaceae bacterium]|nr:2-C-methyl-D-erythritol 4-phosphate cytidylyltransferase [Muribaculaceae bacterium]